MRRVVAGCGVGGSEGDYLVKIKSEGVGKWIYADTDTSGEWVVFGRDGEGVCVCVAGSKVRADWIKGGIGDTCDANSNQLILFWSGFSFWPNKTVMRKNCKRFLQRLVERQKKKKLRKKTVEIKRTGRQRENVLLLSKMEITSQGRKKSHSLKYAKTLMISQFLLIGCEQRKSRELLFFLCVKSKWSAASGWC